MGIYKLGYLKNLDSMSSWDVGKESYDKFGGEVLLLDSKKMCRAIGYVSSVNGNEINCTGIINYPNIANTTFIQAVTAHAFENNEFNLGFIRFVSGSARNKVYQVINTSTTQLVITESTSDGITNGDYFEVVSGSCTFDFPVDRNPINQNFKRTVVNKAQRFPFSQGALVMFEGYQPDDFVLLSHLTTREDADRLELMLNHNLDYKGFDGLYSYDTISGSDDGLAPMILETGSDDTNSQYLVYMNDYKFIRDAKYNSEFSEVMIHFLNYSGVIYRGV
jgi:hypothetical protein